MMTTVFSTIPNILSSLRIIISIFLVFIAVLGEKGIFIFTFFLAILTDILDGFFARLLNQKSIFGAQLDSISDLILMVCAIIGIRILWPTFFYKEGKYILIIVLAEFISNSTGYIKYKRMLCFHTYAGKIASLLLGISVIIILLDFNNNFLLRISSYIYMWVVIEDIIMTILLPEWNCNIPTLWHAIKKVNDSEKN